MSNNHRVHKSSQSDAAHRAYIKTKYNPSPLDLQRQQLTSLLKDPSKSVYIPAPGTNTTTLEQRKRALSPPPEIVSNVAGSSAGAGSGEFHVYKHARRKEFARLALFEEEAAAEREAAEFKNRQVEWNERDRRKTEKNRKRRMKRESNSNKKTNNNNKNGAGDNKLLQKQQQQQQEKAISETESTIPRENTEVVGEGKANNQSAAQNQLDTTTNSEIPVAVAEPSGIDIIDDDFWYPIYSSYTYRTTYLALLFIYQ